MLLQSTPSFHKSRFGSPHFSLSQPPAPCRGAYGGKEWKDNSLLLSLWSKPLSRPISSFTSRDGFFGLETGFFRDNQKKKKKLFKENKKKTMWRILQDFSRGYQWRRTFCSSRLPILSAFVHCCPAFARPDVQNEATPGPFAPTCSPPWSAFAEPRCFFLSGSIGSWHPGTSRCPWYLKSTAMNYSPHFSKSNLHSKNILKRFNSILLCIFITSLHHGTFLPVTNSPQECQLTVSASARSCFVSACFGNSKTPVL